MCWQVGRIYMPCRPAGSAKTLVGPALVGGQNLAVRIDRFQVNVEAPQPARRASTLPRPAGSAGRRWNCVWRRVSERSPRGLTCPDLDVGLAVAQVVLLGQLLAQRSDSRPRRGSPRSAACPRVSSSSTAKKWNSRISLRRQVLRDEAFVLEVAASQSRSVLRQSEPAMSRKPFAVFVGRVLRRCAGCRATSQSPARTD